MDHEGQKDPKDLDVAELEDAGSLPIDTDENSCEEAESPQEQDMSEDEGEPQDACEDDSEQDASDFEIDSDAEAVEENADAVEEGVEAAEESVDAADEGADAAEESVDAVEEGVDLDADGEDTLEEAADEDSSKEGEQSEERASDEVGESDVNEEDKSSSDASSLDQLKATASNALAQGKDALRTARTWCRGHAGASVAIGTCVALAIIACGFAIGANLLISHIDADFEARAEERLAQEKKEEEEILPRIGMRFTSFSHAGFPAISANLTMYSSDGSPLPALTTEHFTLVEVDGDGAEASVGITGLTFDPASGACQLTYNADTATLGGDRTVRINLTEESGYQGGASMSYRV